MKMMQMVRGFINLIKANPTTREHYKSNKLASRKYENEVNESEIKSSSLEQVQQFFNKDTDLVFDALVAADYIDEIDCAISMTPREVQPRQLLQRGSQECRHLQHRQIRPNNRHSISNLCKQ